MYFLYGHNQLFSHLPSRILKIIALVGISSDREIGMQSLHIAADELEDCYRSKLTCFTACFYMFYVEQFFGEYDEISPIQVK